MFSQCGGLQRQVLRELGELQRHAWHLEIPMDAVVYRAYCAARSVVGMLDRLRTREYGSHGHLMFFQIRDGAWHVGKVLEPVFNDFDDFFSALKTRSIISEIRIVNEVKTIHRPAQILPMMQKGHDNQISAFCTEHAAGAGVS